MTVSLQPTSYSKAQTKEVFLKKLALDPKQVCNTPAAFKGYVMEFVPCGQPSSPVGTLDEFYQETNDSKVAVYFQNGDKILVKRNSKNDWLA